MTNQEVMRIVVAAQDGVLVSAQVAMVAFLFSRQSLYSPSLQVLAQHAGITVVTGLGLNWEREGEKGQYFMPVFHQLRSGEHLEFGAQRCDEIRDHFGTSVDGSYKTRVSDLLVRAITPHGQTVLSLGVDVGKSQPDAQREFRLPPQLGAAQAS